MSHDTVCAEDCILNLKIIANYNKTLHACTPVAGNY